MKTLTEFINPGIKVLFSDIDDTMTTEGKLEAKAYSALWKLADNHIRVVPVTGRPAGWCEMIARFWPVDGIIGENGALYFRYLEQEKKMLRHFAVDESTRKENSKKLELIKQEVLQCVPGAAIASDQFTRLFDLAVDFCEDVPPLSERDIQQIVNVFTRHGAEAKVSSIHVNGWFGQYDKLTACKEYCRNEYGWELEENLHQVAFVGDSPNDEPMFGFFENAFAVANIHTFISQLKYPPKYVTPSPGGEGFAELVTRLLFK
ncbi:MAG: HAD family phosphatase [Bdellovibrionaceae bacterium]|nr:HAD family phosphatase [Bdellovibrionales bacterium]MCB9085976.1 HAD family phosphatase [Pseudobdellovibrionaceae bacterium]